MLPRKHHKKAPKISLRSYRRVALAAAVVILLLLIIAVITGSVPGIPGAGSASATAPGSTAPGLLDTILSGILPDQTPPLNKAVPVVTDAPLQP